MVTKRSLFSPTQHLHRSLNLLSTAINLRAKYPPAVAPRGKKSLVLFRYSTRRAEITSRILQRQDIEETPILLEIHKCNACLVQLPNKLSYRPPPAPLFRCLEYHPSYILSKPRSIQSLRSDDSPIAFFNSNECN